MEKPRLLLAIAIAPADLAAPASRHAFSPAKTAGADRGHPPPCDASFGVRSHPGVGATDVKCYAGGGAGALEGATSFLDATVAWIGCVRNWEAADEAEAKSEDPWRVMRWECILGVMPAGAPLQLSSPLPATNFRRD